MRTDDDTSPSLDVTRAARRRACYGVGVRARPSLVVSLVAGLLLAGLAPSGCACGVDELPAPPAQCDLEGRGCLPDEFCEAGQCVKFDRCDDDGDCPSAAYRCTFPSQLCELRPGFDLECVVSTDCDPAHFCALGRCRPVDGARPCARRTDCPQGQACDQVSLFCIEEAPCTLVRDYPEVACDPGETCDEFSGRCRLECQNECTVETEDDDCGFGERCDAACRCVQCLSDVDCGVGLVCNTRAGRCESENLCYDDDECESPLVCNPQTALCQVPLPPCEDDLDCGIAEVCNRVTGNCELPGGACVDDRFEDSDTPATARTFEVPDDGTELLIDELMLCPDDDDVYRFDLLAGQNLIARIDGTTPLARATMWLLDESGETSLRFSESPPYGNATVSYVAQSDETVFLRLTALLGPTPYDMALLIVDGTPCASDDLEGANGNDTPATATTAFPLETPFDATVCPGDVDHYRVSLAAGEALDVALDFDTAAADLDLFLRDAVTGESLDQSASATQDEHARTRSLTARDVVIVVKGFGNASGAYTLLARVLPPYACTPDALEPDEDPASAVLLADGESITDLARSVCIDDKDTFAVPLKDFERVVARAVFAAGEIDLRLTVLDESGETVLRTSPNSGGAETVTYDADGDETVLVRVESLFNSQGDYVLTLFRENQVDCAPDDAEPNGTVLSATAAPVVTTSYTLCGTDQDHFFVDGAAGKRLTARAAFFHADGDVDLVIVGADGTQVLAASDGVTNQEEVSTLLPIDGRYTVRVFSLTEGPKVRYDLEVVVTSDE